MYVFQTPEVPLPETPDPLVDITSAISGDGDLHKKLSESIDVVGSSATTPTVSEYYQRKVVFLDWNLLCFRHLSESCFCMALYSEEYIYKLLSKLSVHTTEPTLTKFHRNDPWVTLTENCSKIRNLCRILVAMATKGKKKL